MVSRIEAVREDLTAFLKPILADKNARIILTGAGTSAFAGQMLAPYLTIHLDRRVEAIATTDIVSNPEEALSPNVPTLIVSFARSGNSPESVEATVLADQLVADCHHLIVTCAEDGALAKDHSRRRRSFVLLTPPETNDRGFAMTSSFTTMCLATMMAFNESVPAEAMVEAAKKLLQKKVDIEALANKRFSRIIYLGSGALTGTARESALKTLELTTGKIGAYYDSPLGFRHGPKSLVNDASLVVVYLSQNAHTRAYDSDLIAELRGDGANIAVVSLDEVDGVTDPMWTIDAPTMKDAEAGLIYVLFAQLMAYYSSVALGLTVDNPFPGGRVNRVVKGVTIHPLG